MTSQVERSKWFQYTPLYENEQFSLKMRLLDVFTRPPIVQLTPKIGKELNIGK